MTKVVRRRRSAGKRVATKRQHVAAPPLPPVSGAVVDAVVEMLMTDYGMKRPPEKSAALLALICELYKQGQPFPERQQVADKLDCSVYTIDAALSTRTDEGYLTQVMETETGNVRNRPHSTVRRRYYIPSKRLVEVVDQAQGRVK